jgi:thiol-disulfide isomerase/thioredoxin
MPFENIGVLQDVDFDQKGNLKTSSFGAGNKPVLIMIWGSYCGHCKTAKPGFAKVFDENKQKKVFLATIQTDDKDPDVQRLMKRLPQILRVNGVAFNGVPSYVLYHNGAYAEYAGGRDYQSLQNFITSL